MAQYKEGMKVGKLTLEKAIRIKTPSKSEPTRTRPGFECICDCGNHIAMINKLITKYPYCGSCTAYDTYNIDPKAYTKKYGIELWKKFPLESKYEISSWGRVRIVMCGGRLLYKKPAFDKDGYFRMDITSPNFSKRTRTFTVHKLVALTFLDEQGDNKVFINHKNEIRYCNAASNLEWCTPSYNMYYGSKRTKTRKTRQSNNNITDYYLYKNGKLILARGTRAASVYCEMSTGGLCKAAQKVKQSYSGWQITKSLDGINTNLKKWRPVVVDDGEKITMYKNRHDVQKKTDLNFHNINKSIRTNKRVKGYKIRYMPLSTTIDQVGVITYKEEKRLAS